MKAQRWALAGAWLAPLAVFSALQAHAQAMPQAPMKDASVQEMVDQLAPPKATTRSLRNITPQRRQIELVINFDFDSARLQPQSLPLLEKLAEAMKTERLEPVKFRVEGHTDAKGAARYNDELSARRARAVAAFLREQGVSEERLQAEGRGSSDLLNRDQPMAPENRRVRIVALD